MTNLGDVFRGFRISSSGLSAERTRINVIASNIANAHTTRMPGSDEPAPYQRQVVHFEPVLERHAGEGVIARRNRFAGKLRGGIRHHDTEETLEVLDQHHSLHGDWECA